MSLEELGSEVKKVVKAGRFQEYVQQRLWELRGIERETEIDVLWLVVRNSWEEVYEDAQRLAFGHRRDFQLHGRKVLGCQELTSQNRELGYLTKPFLEALQTVNEYAVGGK